MKISQSGAFDPIEPHLDPIEPLVDNFAKAITGRSYSGRCTTTHASRELRVEYRLTIT